MAKRHRKHYWIDRQIQGSLAIRVLLHWTVFALIATVLTIAMQVSADPFAPFADQIDKMWNNQGPFAIILLVLLPIFIYDTIKLSNRFAGPVLRLRRVLTQIAEGKPAEKLTFRDNDFWRGMARDFNVLVEKGYFDVPPAQRDVNTSDERQLQEVG